MRRCLIHEPRGGSRGPVAATLTLAREARRLRRRALDLPDGTRVLLDLPATVTLEDGDALVLEDGTRLGIRAAAEPLLSALPQGDAPLAALAWHLGNRHLPAEIRDGRVLTPDAPHVRALLQGLGARVEAVMAPFRPLAQAAAHDHGPAHGHGPAHDPDGDRGHGHGPGSGHG